MNLNKKQLHIKRLVITALGVFAALLLVLFGLSVFFGKYTLTFQSPIQFRPLILIKENTTLNPLVSVVEAQETDSGQAISEPQPTNPIEQEILDVFGKEEYFNAIKIFKCESGLDPEAKNVNTNGSIDGGLAQINSVHKIDLKWLKNYEINIRVAKQLFDEQGWSPWVCSRKVKLDAKKTK